MNSFVEAVSREQDDAFTGNYGKTYRTSGDKVVDFFAAAGNRNVILNDEFDRAFQDNPSLAFRVALWMRDIRGGAGERQTFRYLLSHLEKNYFEQTRLLIYKIPIIGRWDDLLVFTDKKLRDASFNLIRHALYSNNKLCAKWMPRQGKDANDLRKYLNLTPKQYRKLLVNLSKDVVETKMSSKRWDDIEFDKVPSLAAARYQSAFTKHCKEAYTQYKMGLRTINDDGTTKRKINVGAVYPYDIIKSITHGDRDIAQAQWDALPNFLGDAQILPMIDVSGSMMSWNYYNRQHMQGKPHTLTPYDIAISLGLYCADKQHGPFSNMFMTFDTIPELKRFTSSTIYSKINEIAKDVGYNTNIQAAFAKILDVAVRNEVSQYHMPEILLILSDMEFDNNMISGNDVTAFEASRAMFEQAGYKLPSIVFWNINGRSTNMPVKQHETGTAMVSGFSHQLFKAVVGNKLDEFDPFTVMVDILNSPRYDVPGLTV